MKSSEKFPLRLLFWESTAGCNLECIHCRRLDVSKTLMKDDLTGDEVKAMVDDLAKFSNAIFVLSGGEPLIRPDIFDIASFANNSGLRVALASNGTMIDAKVARQIKEAGIKRVSVSIDGATPEVHDKFRGIPGSYEKAIDGIRNLKAAGVPVQLNATVARHNVDTVKDIYKKALDLGVGALHLFMLVPVGCGVEVSKDHQLTPEKYEEVLNWFYDVFKEKKIELKATCAPHFFRIAYQRAKQEGLSAKELFSAPHKAGDSAKQEAGMASMTRGCLAATGICFVSHRGEVFPCGYLPVVAGNIRQQPLSEIWARSPVFNKLRDLSNIEGKCGVCEFLHLCEGCRARAFGEVGNYLAEEPYCIYQPRRARS